MTTNHRLAVAVRRALAANFWAVLVAAAFATVYACSLSLVYVEGDDAASIAYHLMGRNPELQQPYADYQRMMDVVLSLVPARERLLRTVSIVLTSVAAACMLLLLLRLVFGWLGHLPPAHRNLVAVAVVLASPEFFYLGLVYSPTVIAMCFVLAAHLLARWNARSSGPPHRSRTKTRLAAALSMGLFGFGVACRWNVVVYGVVVFCDCIFDRRTAGTHQAGTGSRFAPAIVWCFGALIASFAAVTASGVGPGLIVKAVRGAPTVTTQAGTVADDEASRRTSRPSGLLYTVATLQTLVTPAFAMLGAWGLLLSIRRRSHLPLVVMVGLVAVLPWVRSGVPKFLLPAVPGLVACVATGFLQLWFGKACFRPLGRLALLALLVVPWIVGLRVTSRGSAWGPGFEIRPYDRVEAVDRSMALALGAGSALPTFEGPRSLFGHGAVLLGTGWRRLVTSHAVERRRAVEEAIGRAAPLVITAWSPSFVTNDLVARGFATDDPDRTRADEYFVRRRFRSRDGREATVLYHEIPHEAAVEDIRALGAAGPTLIVLGNPRTMRSLYEYDPRALVKLGSLSAVFLRQPGTVAAVR